MLIRYILLCFVFLSSTRLANAKAVSYTTTSYCSNNTGFVLQTILSTTSLTSLASCAIDTDIRPAGYYLTYVKRKFLTK